MSQYIDYNIVVRTTYCDGGRGGGGSDDMIPEIRSTFLMWFLYFHSYNSQRADFVKLCRSISLNDKIWCAMRSRIDLLAILQKSLDRAIFLYNFIRKVR